MPSTSKRGAATKGKKVKGVSVSQKPRRNSTRVTNKYRLKSKAMFNPSIKEENFIIIEDDYENVEASTRKRAKGLHCPRNLSAKKKEYLHHLQGL
jgi:hypothetical protein